ncbi:SAGA complex subunit spt20, partial [Smittium mucronatum]
MINTNDFDQSSDADSANEIIKNELNFLNNLNNENYIQSDSLMSDNSDEFEDVEMDLEDLINEEIKEQQFDTINSESLGLNPKIVSPNRDEKDKVDLENTSYEVIGNLSSNLEGAPETPIKITKLNTEKKSDFVQSKESIKENKNEAFLINQTHCPIGDVDLLKRYKLEPPSLLVHLYETHFKFEKQEGVFLYNDSTKFFFDALNEGRIPFELLEIISEIQVRLYEGCLIVDLYDYRKTEATDHNNSFTNFCWNSYNYSEKIPSNSLKKKQKNSKPKLSHWDSMNSIKNTFKQLENIYMKKTSSNYDINSTKELINKDNTVYNSQDKTVKLYRKIMRPSPETMHLDLLLMKKKFRATLSDINDVESKLLLLTEMDLDLNPSTDILLKKNALNYLNNEHFIPKKRRKYNQAEIEAEKNERKEKQKILKIMDKPDHHEFQPSFNRLGFSKEFYIKKEQNLFKPLEFSSNNLQDSSIISPGLTKVNNQIPNSRKNGTKKSKKSSFSTNHVSGNKTNQPFRIIRFSKSFSDHATYFTVAFYPPEPNKYVCRCILRIGTKVDTAIDGDSLEFFISNEALSEIYSSDVLFLFSIENIKLIYDSNPKEIEINEIDSISSLKKNDKSVQDLGSTISTQSKDSIDENITKEPKTSAADGNLKNTDTDVLSNNIISMDNQTSLLSPKNPKIPEHSLDSAILPSNTETPVISSAPVIKPVPKRKVGSKKNGKNSKTQNPSKINDPSINIPVDQALNHSKNQELNNNSNLTKLHTSDPIDSINKSAENDGSNLKSSYISSNTLNNSVDKISSNLENPKIQTNDISLNNGSPDSKLQNFSVNIPLIQKAQSDSHNHTIADNFSGNSAFVQQNDKNSEINSNHSNSINDTSNLRSMNSPNKLLAQNFLNSGDVSIQNDTQRSIISEVNKDEFSSRIILQLQAMARMAGRSTFSIEDINLLNLTKPQLAHLMRSSQLYQALSVQHNQSQQQHSNKDGFINMQGANAQIISKDLISGPFNVTANSIPTDSQMKTYNQSNTAQLKKTPILDNNSGSGLDFNSVNINGQSGSSSNLYKNKLQEKNVVSSQFLGGIAPNNVQSTSISSNLHKSQSMVSKTQNSLPDEVKTIQNINQLKNSNLDSDRSIGLNLNQIYSQQ